MAQGEQAVADVTAKLGPDAEAARELSYRLYRICDQKNWTQDALGYNALARSWGEISGLASRPAATELQTTLFDRG